MSEERMEEVFGYFGFGDYAIEREEHDSVDMIVGRVWIDGRGYTIDIPDTDDFDTHLFEELGWLFQEVVSSNDSGEWSEDEIDNFMEEMDTRPDDHIREVVDTAMREASEQRRRRNRNI